MHVQLGRTGPCVVAGAAVMVIRSHGEAWSPHIAVALVLINSPGLETLQLHARMRPTGQWSLQVVLSGMVNVSCTLMPC